MNTMELDLSRVYLTSTLRVATEKGRINKLELTFSGTAGLQLVNYISDSPSRTRGFIVRITEQRNLLLCVSHKSCQ